MISLRTTILEDFRIFINKNNIFRWMRDGNLINGVEGGGGPNKERGGQFCFDILLSASVYSELKSNFFGGRNFRE